MTQDMLSGLDSPIGDVNQPIVTDLLVSLTERSLVDGSLIGSDGLDGISISWPKLGLFCDVTCGKIYISRVSDEIMSYQDIKLTSYESDKISDVCVVLASVIHG